VGHVRSENGAEHNAYSQIVFCDRFSPLRNVRDGGAQSPIGVSRTSVKTNENAVRAALLFKF